MAKDQLLARPVLAALLLTALWQLSRIVLGAAALHIGWMRATPWLYRDIGLRICDVGVAASLFRYVGDRRSLTTLLHPSPTTVLVCVSGIAIGLSLEAMRFAVEHGLGWFRVVGVCSNFPLGAVCCQSFLIAASEEICFRGAVLWILLGVLRPSSAIAVSAILAACCHMTVDMYYNAATVAVLAYFFRMLSLGLLFGSAYLAFRNIWFVIGLHFGWDVLESIFYGFFGAPGAYILAWGNIGTGFLSPPNRLSYAFVIISTLFFAVYAWRVQVSGNTWKLGERLK